MTGAEESPQVAPSAAAAYRPRVSFRLLLSLILLAALVLGPVSLLGASPAMAMNDLSEAAAGHLGVKSAAPCHGSGQQQDEQGPDSGQMYDSCCVTMCSAIPETSRQLAGQVPPRQILQRRPADIGSHGLEPEADPPPPRFA